jgi:hypothetical protein
MSNFVGQARGSRLVAAAPSAFPHRGPAVPSLLLLPSVAPPPRIPKRRPAAPCPRPLPPRCIPSQMHRALCRPPRRRPISSLLAVIRNTPAHIQQRFQTG